MLSDRAFMALADLDHGARLNSIHSVARELIHAGLAIDEWGYLRLTEAGRQVGRGKLPRSLQIEDGNIADLSYRIDPMSNPVVAPEQIAHPPTTPAPAAAVITPDPEIRQALTPAGDEYTRALRAAGIATGLTGTEWDAKWVQIFVEAFVNQT
jgi:hypothetical protein